MVHLNLVSVGMVQDTGSVILVLRAQDLARLLVMEIGLLEGRAIALEAEGIRAPRPLTHDLLFQVIEKLGARVVEAQIRKYQDKTFFAALVLEQPEGHRIEIDSRPSDAIALALRTGAPVCVAEQVLAEAGIDESDGEPVFDSDNDDEDEDEDEEDEDEEGEETVIH